MYVRTSGVMDVGDYLLIGRDDSHPSPLTLHPLPLHLHDDSLPRSVRPFLSLDERRGEPPHDRQQAHAGGWRRTGQRCEWIDLLLLSLRSIMGRAVRSGRGGSSSPIVVWPA